MTRRHGGAPSVWHVRRFSVEPGTIARERSSQEGCHAIGAKRRHVAFLVLGLGAIALSLALQLGGRGKWGNFVAQWVPTLLIIGLYNKMVKVGGHDRMDR